MSDIIIAASIAAGGVIATQISLHVLERWKAGRDDKKEKSRVQQEAQKLAEARRFEMKKEQYQKLLTGLSDSVSNLAEIINVSGGDLREIRPTDDARRALALKDLIASREILLLSIDAGDALADATFAMLELKTCEVKAQVGAETLQPNIQALLQRSNHALDLITGLRAEGKSASKEASDLQEHFAQVHARLDPLILKQQQLAQERMQHLESMQALIFELLPPILEKIADLKIAIREDLGFEVDDRIASAIQNVEGQARLKQKAQRVVTSTFQNFGFPLGHTAPKGPVDVVGGESRWSDLNRRPAHYE